MSTQDREPFWLRHPFIVMGLVLAGMLILGAVGWGVKVALSPVKGAGDVIIEQNKAETIIGSQEELQERYAGITAACSKIGIAKKALAASPDSFTAKKDYTGAQMHYVTLVAQYNAMTQKLTAENQVGSLPTRINPDSCPGASS